MVMPFAEGSRVSQQLSEQGQRGKRGWTLENPGGHALPMHWCKIGGGRTLPLCFCRLSTHLCRIGGGHTLPLQLEEDKQCHECQQRPGQRFKGRVPSRAIFVLDKVMECLAICLDKECDLGL
eukprot:scaffold135089_cov18-Tisochrysis_lutea.AAC.1